MLHDVHNAINLAGLVTTTVNAHKTALTGSFPSGKICCYEGGPQTGVSTGAVAATAATKSRSWARHPRIYENYLAYLQQLEAAGVSVYHRYSSVYVIGTQYDTSDASWQDYLGCSQLNGTGDGLYIDNIQVRRDNRTNYENMDSIVSVTGLAAQNWLLLENGGGVGGRGVGGVRDITAWATTRKNVTRRSVTPWGYVS